MASNSTLKNPAERLPLLILPSLDAGVAVDTLSRDFETDGNEKLPMIQRYFAEIVLRF